jgi:hypothetical protein
LGWSWRVYAPLINADMAKKMVTIMRHTFRRAFRLLALVFAFFTQAKPNLARALTGGAVPDAVPNYV